MQNITASLTIEQVNDLVSDFISNYSKIIRNAAVQAGLDECFHADLINQATAKAFTEISVSSGVPVIDGVVSAESLEQAVERCGTKQGNKGFSAMQAAIETANVAKKL